MPAPDIQYHINDPGTNNEYLVTLAETSRAEITHKKRMSELIQAEVLRFEPQDSNTILMANLITAANSAATSMESAGYI